MKHLVFVLFCFYHTFSVAQNINENFEKWPVVEKAINITGIDLSPDGNTLAMVCGKNQPLLLYDYKTKTIIQEINVNSKCLGYNVFYSKKGNYLLLQEKKIETSFKKAKQADYVIVDLNSNKVIHSFNKISDAKISFDEKQVITLENGTVYFRDIKTGKKHKEFKPEGACNALAISPDGKDLAVVKKPTKSDIKMLASKNVSKKAIKSAAKSKHLITIYDTESYQLKSLIPDFYDNINLLFYTDNGDRLLSFNVASNSYINVALPKEDYQPTREGYLSRTSTQPEFAYSPNGEHFGVATVEAFPSLNIYDVESGSVIDRYDTKMKIWKNMKKKIYAGSNTSFVFLPDNKHVLIAYGNSLIKWRFDKE
ncbi:MAG: hypothetical protein JKY48_17665 [Flavobacteriales bacterium]|nr:hypothetical protein [Flavobacteriales bacterium]